MEEENKPEEVAVEESAQPSREEILAISRKENKDCDERDMQWRDRAGTFAFCTGLLLAGVVMLVTVLVNDRVPCEIYFIISGMQSVQGLIIGIKCSGKIKKVYLVQGILLAVLTICFLTFWILQLCGVLGAKL